MLPAAVERRSLNRRLQEGGEVRRELYAYSLRRAPRLSWPPTTLASVHASGRSPWAPIACTSIPPDLDHHGSITSTSYGNYTTEGAGPLLLDGSVAARSSLDYGAALGGTEPSAAPCILWRHRARGVSAQTPATWRTGGIPFYSNGSLYLQLNSTTSYDQSANDQPQRQRRPLLWSTLNLSFAVVLRPHTRYGLDNYPERRLAPVNGPFGSVTQYRAALPRVGWKGPSVHLLRWGLHQYTGRGGNRDLGVRRVHPAAEHYTATQGGSYTLELDPSDATMSLVSAPPAPSGPMRRAASSGFTFRWMAAVISR